MANTASKTGAKKITLRQMAESGILLALGFVLSILKVRLIAGGGSVTIASMLPIVILAYKYGPAWGTLCGVAHSLIQVIEGGGIAPPVQDVTSYLLVFLLDFVLAWGAVGLIAGLLRGIPGKPRTAIAAGAFFGIAGRFLCSFISGVIIWGVYAPEGQSAALYSLLANGAVMIPEMLITTVAGFAIFSIPVMQKQVFALETK